MKKQILLFLLTFLPLLAHAFTGEVEIDGIMYFIKTGAHIAEVRAKNSGYSGDVVIPPSVEYGGVTCNVILIADGAFTYCSSLTSVNIPNSVTSIGKYAFYGCTSLTSIILPNSVTSIGGGAFFSCSSLTSVTIPNGVTSINGDTFYGCTSLTSIILPNSVTSIGERAFDNCTSLPSIILPNSVTSIGKEAFFGCTKLVSVTIGSGIQHIDYQALAYCPDLTHVYCHAVNVPDTDSDVLEYSYPQYATLHVPDESVENYRNHDTWSKFGTIVGLSGGDGSNKCAKPTISYQSGKLVFNSEIEGATCHSSITDTDINNYDSNEVQLTVTYNVSVFATKAGMENSDVATATLCWIDKEPVINTDISNAAEFAAKAVLIQSEGGTLTIQGADDGTPVSIYTSAGIQAGSAVSKNGVATISTSMQPSSIAIIKIGNRSVKYMVP